MNQQVSIDDFYHEYSNGRVFNEDKAICYLIEAGYLIIASPGGHMLYKDDSRQAVVWIMANDVFAWACAELIPCSMTDIEPLLVSVINDPNWGGIRYVCIKENQKPQKVIQHAMLKAGSWDAKMEQLPDNKYEKAQQEKNKN